MFRRIVCLGTIGLPLLLLVIVRGQDIANSFISEKAHDIAYKFLKAVR